MELAESGAANVLLPFCRQPSSNRQAIERGLKINTLIFPDPCVSMGANASITLRIWGKIDIVESEQCFCDEKMALAQEKMGHTRHFQCAAVRAVLEIGAVRRDEQMRAEKARLFAAQRPRDVGGLRFNSLQDNPVRQKNCEPPMKRGRFGFVLVNLDLNLAGLNVDVIELPAPGKYRPRIKLGCDTASADRFHRLLSVDRLKTFALRGQGAGPPNSRILPVRKLQAFRGFIFHGLTKGIAFDVMREQRTKKQRHAGCGRDRQKNRNRSDADQQFSSQDGKR